ncbi:MAG: ABC transporter permease [Chloroflexota bacterium]
MLTIPIKDLKQSSRTLSAYIFMFVIPILVTMLFYFMFGSTGSEDNGFALPQTKVAIVNQDRGQLTGDIAFDVGTGTDPSFDLADAESMGDILTMLLMGENFSEILEATEMANVDAARAAVDNQDVGVAIIIPPNFTDAISGQGARASVEMYQDPTLTIGPSIVEGITSQILDAFSASNIGVSVTMEQLIESGIPANPELIQEVVAVFTAGPNAQGSSTFASAAELIKMQTTTSEDNPTNLITQIVSVILAGVMVMFSFFTGAASMETILIEEERGTLARLFTTPNSTRMILGGKALAVFITLVVQILVLLTFGFFVFNIDWGEVTAVMLASVGLTITAAATGLFLVSFLQNTRQSGIIFGGVLTLTGMLGLIPVFTAGVPDQPEAVEIVSLLVPQGWAVRGYTIALNGGSITDVLPTFGVLVLWSLFFALFGQRRLQKRFA